MIRIVAGELLYDREDLVAAGAETFPIPSPAAPQSPAEVDIYPAPSGIPGRLAQLPADGLPVHV